MKLSTFRKRLEEAGASWDEFVKEGFAGNATEALNEVAEWDDTPGWLVFNFTTGKRWEDISDAMKTSESLDKAKAEVLFRILAARLGYEVEE